MKSLKNLTFLLSLSLSSFFAHAQTISISNELVSRSVDISNNKLLTTAINLKGGEKSYVVKSSDFSFYIDDERYDGMSSWNIVDHTQTTDNSGVKLTTITLKDGRANPQFQITLNYALYPGLPLIRKWIDFENIGNRDMKIENLNVEDLETTLFSIHSVVYNNYARMKHLMKYEGDWDDAVAVVHNVPEKRGIALGNEAPMVLKRTTYHTDNNNIEIGLTPSDHKYPFRKWLTPSQKWSSPKTFICLYQNEEDGFQVINNEVNKFVTNNMGNRVTNLKHKPTFVYNTWYPFRSFIDDKLVRDIAKSAAECGIQEFVIDDGWQCNVDGVSANANAGQNYGDWLVDTNKFPDGLKPTFDYIKSLGMKPGLWVSLASANSNSQVFKDHPEWFVKDQQGEITNLHSQKINTMYTTSFGTEWVDYIKEVLLRLVNEHGLEYAKLDLAIATSPYCNDDSHTGSYSKNDPDFRDRPESFIVFYENLLKLFDDLHEQAPDLFIDCTFETAGKNQLMDYAISKHAEGNWLSNFEGNAPHGSLRVRQMAWWRSPALPASSLVIGNMAMDDPNFELTLKSLIGTLPIALGDPRKLSSQEKKNMKRWADWMNQMQEKHDYMKFRKDLKGFGEPREGYWDGWQRLNFNTLEGGVFGLFRQGGAESSRIVLLDDLNPNANYVVKEAPTGKTVYSGSGKSLMEKGFKVTMNKEYDGIIFEVCLK